MTAYVALLRGVNVGGRGKVAMADLRRTFEAFGYAEVSTYIQSGNVIFTSSIPVPAVALEAAIATDFGLAVAVMLRTSAQMKRVVQRNPFADVDASKVHVGFMTQRSSAAVVQKLDLQRFKPEDVVIDGSELYFHLPNGMGRAKLPGYAGRQLDVPITVRNWNTVTKLVELTAAVTA